MSFTIEQKVKCAIWLDTMVNVKLVQKKFRQFYGIYQRVPTDSDIKRWHSRLMATGNVLSDGIRPPTSDEIRGNEDEFKRKKLEFTENWKIEKEDFLTKIAVLMSEKDQLTKQVSEFQMQDPKSSEYESNKELITVEIRSHSSKLCSRCSNKLSSSEESNGSQSRGITGNNQTYIQEHTNDEYKDILNGMIEDFETQNKTNVQEQQKLKKEIEVLKSQVQKPEENKKIKISWPWPSNDKNKNTDDHLDENQNRSPCGIDNKKGTCYMNAMMHALASSTKIIDEFKNIKRPFARNDKLGKFIEILETLNKSSSTHDCYKKLVEFMNTVKWDRQSQQDAFQLLSFFINAIQEEIGFDKTSMPPKIMVLHTFSENSDFNKLQDHLALALPLCGNFRNWPGVDIKDMVKAFFEPSLIDDGPHQTAMYLYDREPEVMLFHIQANEWSYDHNRYYKPRYYIKYTSKLQYKFKIKKDISGSSECIVRATYQLVAVVEHIGSIFGGHYITYRRCGQQWYEVNDRRVSPTPFQFNIVPYIMVYEKA